MAATTITRTTWTNDTGTPATPVNDGTIINNARLQEIYANIDALIAADITFGGLVAAEGQGTHTFNANHNGTQTVAVRNSSSGAAAFAQVIVGNNTRADATTLTSFSSGHASAPSISILDANMTGGLIIRALDTVGAITFRTGGNDTRLVLAPDGTIQIGPSGNGNYGMYQSQVVNPSASTGGLLYLNGTINGAVNNNMVGLFCSPTLVENSSGTHAIVASAFINPPTITGGAAAVTNATTLYVNGPAAASGASNYAVFVSSGATFFGGNVSLVAAANLTIGTGGAGDPGYLELGYGPSDNGAAGRILFRERDGAAQYVWVDTTGVMRIHTAAPTTSSAASDTAGTVVGAQTSTRATKRDVRVFGDYDGALRLIAKTPLYRFRYTTQDLDTDHVGIVAEESPEFARFGGQAFDPVNAFGYTAAAIKALLARLERLEAAAAPVLT